MRTLSRSKLNMHTLSMQSSSNSFGLMTWETAAEKVHHRVLHSAEALQIHCRRDNMEVTRADLIKELCGEVFAAGNARARTNGFQSLREMDRGPEYAEVATIHHSSTQWPQSNSSPQVHSMITVCER
mmetsp:Transcript_64439/g.153837  ORF Transcript_64439/g.153837 Transcript_64439/m.153837 type:complete len:127 (-) Transcript_64439:864-1244(-)